MATVKPPAPVTKPPKIPKSSASKQAINRPKTNWSSASAVNRPKTLRAQQFKIG